MKLLFVRHGQDEDDINNTYGGWNNSALSEVGKTQIKHILNGIKDLQIHFSKIISSPLQRAVQSSEIISEHLTIPFEINEYLKEWNKYGILTGMNKEVAQEKYPELVSNIQGHMATGYVVGAERIQDFSQRVSTVFFLLQQQKEPFIVVTHGGVLRELFRQFGTLFISEMGDGAYILADLSADKLVLLRNEGVSFDPLNK